MGGCLHALHSSCPDEVIKLTAADLVNVFPRSMQTTRSHELKVNLVAASNFGQEGIMILVNLIAYSAYLIKLMNSF